MTSSMVVPVIDVQNDNFKELWPAMVLAIKTSSFIALDTELSGLGNRKALLAESIEDRYKAICHAARTRSILSLGLACYKKQDREPADTYLVQVYNLTLLCSEEYIIEPQSVQFLVQHGFDFNKQYAQGVPYCKGNKGATDHRGVTIRGLFTELLRARKPLVLHNGLIDMVFLYQCFYAHLPERLGTFTADLSEMLPAGIYDTKYAVEFELRFTASYLEYAYKKCKLDNSRSVASGRAGAHIHLEFCQYPDQMSSYVDYRSCPAVTEPEGGQPSDVCLQFSAFGWCANGSQCPRSHDTDLIILQDEQDKNNKRMKRKRKREKKRESAAGGDDKNGSSIFDGAPENKVSHMEMDEEEPPVPLVQSHGETSDPQPETEPAPGSPKVEGPCLVSGTSTMQAAQEENGTPQKNEDDSAAVMMANAVERDISSEKAAKMEAKKKQKLEAGSHRAGFDAFMTGYIFAHASALSKREGGGGGQGNKTEDSWLPDCLNKVYLSGKAAPLQIVKSTFSKSSRAHMNMMEIVWGKDVARALADRAQQGNDQN